MKTTLQGKAFPVHLIWILIAGVAGLLIGLGFQSGNRSLTAPLSVPADHHVPGSAGESSAVLATISDTIDAPYLVVLGVVQDAGYPQAGCYEPHCLPGWQPGQQRGAVSLGLVTKENKYLFEATPNLPEQLYHLEQYAPNRSHALSGIFITHAHIGHYAGLMFLGHEAMGADGVPVYVMPRMRAFLTNNGPWSQLVNFGNIDLRSLRNKQAVVVDGVSVTAFEVPHRDEYSETVGYEIRGAGVSAVFIPDINKWADWETKLVDVVAAHDHVLIDGAFFADGELPGRDMSKIPHPFVSETMQLLDELDPVERNKVWFIHMNHTNPLLREDSEESRVVKAAGYNVAREGVVLPLN